MAMKFGKAVTDTLFASYLKPAVKQAGFDLRRLDERPRPELIDQNMEVELRLAKFVVADLSHGNRGAYWEAGFASGLGKPVFYLCGAARFRRAGSHFDTNHHFTILCDANDMPKAGEDLKISIRFHLPEDAKLTDDL
jgi:nucleoside 2-deoxyribosyltransferase